MLAIDATLKDLFGALPRTLVRAVYGLEPVEIVTVELSGVSVARPDLLVWLEDGSLLHIEVQTDPDSRMPVRMLRYRAALEAAFLGIAIRQMVLLLRGNKARDPGALDPADPAENHASGAASRAL